MIQLDFGQVFWPLNCISDSCLNLDNLSRAMKKYALALGESDIVKMADEANQEAWNIMRYIDVMFPERKEW